MITRVVRLVVVLCILSCASVVHCARVIAQEIEPACTTLPHSIRISNTLQPVVAELLRKSGTFRRQCARIAATRKVRIDVIANGAPRAIAVRARATISRYSYGLVKVVIEFPAAADYFELLPHEFEHVLEQMEGLDLPALARAGDRRVVEVEEGTFETTRAREAGLAAAAEVRAEPDPVITGAGRALSRIWRGLSSRAVRDAAHTSTGRR